MSDKPSKYDTMTARDQLLINNMNTSGLSLQKKTTAGCSNQQQQQLQLAQA
jgi:hypothetical protein